MKKMLLLSLALIFPVNAVAMNPATPGIDKVLAAKIGLAIASGPAIYGLYLGTRKLGMKKCVTISKGIVAAIFGAHAIIFASALDKSTHAPVSPTQGIIGSAVCGLLACICGNSVIEDIKEWNKTN